jgi:uncharacterized integral membrane protein (TIGR00697 family)
MNFLILIVHIIITGSLTLFFLRLGKEAACAFVAMLALVANLFVSKQITLFGLNITCSDALAVGYLLGSNLIQEFFGLECAKKTIWISFSLSVAFVIFSCLHLLYQPNIFDQSHTHFIAILKPLPRLTVASFFAFLVTQSIDLSLFSYLKKKMSGRFITFRVLFCTSIAHLLDTVLFSFAGLYGVVASVTAVILVSFAIKLLVILLTTPFIVFSKKVVST